MGKAILPTTPDINGLLYLLQLHGGKIISSNELPSDLIAQAKASNRMYVDENSLGYIWEPPFAGRFPMTEKEVELFELCYPIDTDIPNDLTFEKILNKINKG